MKNKIESIYEKKELLEHELKSLVESIKKMKYLVPTLRFHLNKK